MEERNFNMKKNTSKVLLGFLLAVTSVGADEIRPGSFEIGPLVGYSYLGDYGAEKPENALLYGLRAGIFMTNHVSFETSFNYIKTSTNLLDLDVQKNALRFNLTYNMLTASVVNPLITGGLGWNRYKSDSLLKSNDLGVNAGVGVRIRLAKHFNTRLDAIYEYVETDFSDREHNYEAALSLNYMFGTEAPKDTDGDSVVDKKDACAETPRGATVDAKGCPSDEDSDKVPNGIDQCPKTFPGFIVDAKGCEMDTDGDAVPDGPDACADTPKGAPVDAKGCPKDSDKDNVADFIDQCAGTPEGVAVDEKGCPKDLDNDGVLDTADQCPNTAAGTKVDEKGCPLVVKSKGVLKGVNFLSGKAVLTADSSKVLDDVATELLSFPAVKVEVQGHTDNIGADKINQNISQARAQAVVDYLVSKGVESSRLIAKGYGKTQPIDTNKTKNGRAKNRRVELKWLEQ